MENLTESYKKVVDEVVVEMEIKRVIPEIVKKHVVKTVLKLVEEHHLTILNLEEINESIKNYMLSNATLEKEFSL